MREEWERRERSGATVDLMGVVAAAAAAVELELERTSVEARLGQNLREAAAEEEE